MSQRLSRSTLQFLTIFLLLLAARLPFFLTHHIQEDAYITLRCAENLAETGVYGFNPGEQVSASTSHSYALLAAGIHLVVGREAFIPAMQMVNTMLFLCGAYLLARVLSPENRRTFTLWALISLLPISLMISYSGMETSLLIFLLGVAAHLLQHRRHPVLAWIAISLIPWVRPEAVAYALILVFWYCLHEKRLVLAPLLALMAGITGLAAFNLLYFGNLLNQSIVAKSFSHTPFSLIRFLTNLRLVFAENVGGVFNPIRTKYFEDLGYIFLALVTAGILFYLWRIRQDRKRLFFALALASMAYGVSIAYAAGGVVFPWYLWPCTFLAYALLSALVLDGISAATHVSRMLIGLVMILLVGMFVLQWAYSYNWGTKEGTYRRGIGEYLAEISSPGETLFLEPAGYIPYYSGLYTYDEVGLVSPLVLQYRAADPQGWWLDFVREVQPTWLVQRGHMVAYRTYQGYELNGEEREWFDTHYSLVSSFSYRPEDYTRSPLLLKMLELGTADDYYIYRLKP